MSPAVTAFYLLWLLLPFFFPHMRTRFHNSVIISEMKWGKLCGQN